MVSVCRMSVCLCYLARSHAIASLIEFLWFSFINFGTVAGQWCKIRDCPAIFRTVGNYVNISAAKEMIATSKSLASACSLFCAPEAILTSKWPDPLNSHIFFGENSILSAPEESLGSIV